MTTANEYWSPLRGAGEEACRRRLCGMFGILGWWAVTPDRGELARRAGEHDPGLRRLDVIAALHRLPLDVLVPEVEVRRTDLRLFARLPSFVLGRTGGAVIRRVSPPLQVDHVVVPSRAFRPGLEAASQFSTYCARSMLLPAQVEMGETDLAEANYYGVGVYRTGTGSTVELVAPEPFGDCAETPASWAFSEDLYRQLGELN